MNYIFFIPLLLFSTSSLSNDSQHKGLELHLICEQDQKSGALRPGSLEHALFTMPRIVTVLKNLQDTIRMIAEFMIDDRRKRQQRNKQGDIFGPGYLAGKAQFVAVTMAASDRSNYCRNGRCFSPPELAISNLILAK